MMPLTPPSPAASLKTRRGDKRRCLSLSRHRRGGGGAFPRRAQITRLFAHARYSPEAIFAINASACQEF